MAALTLGAATTVAVAWGLAFWRAWRGYGVGIVYDNIGRSYEGEFDGQLWWVLQQRGPGYGSFTYLGSPVPMEHVSRKDWPRLAAPPWCPPDRNIDQRWVMAFGWPCLAACFRAEGTDLAMREGVDYAFHGALKFGEIGRGTTVRLPLIPIASGMACDTAFYAAAWSTTVWGCAYMRRRWRRRGGRCGRCGYDRRGLDGAPCPECGLALRAG